ncbi:glutathione S-transferase T2-like [Impatiens glandulifera]|uniref:glutathione S-transferase T2-like n=1 Tax=Impatiens glandulifera TaxID=253017 RepID=UPI001FB140F8|nr:glutathione S-transferase T2-like [Impatiens glandulifera]
MNSIGLVTHWGELRRHPKWRTPSTNSGSTKRTKLSGTRAYSSSTNNDTPTDTNDGVESPVRPQGTKAAKRKGKRKEKIKAVEEYEEIKVVACRKLSLMDEFNKNQQKDLELKQQELDMKFIMADTNVMNETQRKIHASLLEQIAKRRS